MENSSHLILSTFKERGKLAVDLEKEANQLSIQRKRQIGCQFEEKVNQSQMTMDVTAYRLSLPRGRFSENTRAQDTGIWWSILPDKSLPFQVVEPPCWSRRTNLYLLVLKSGFSCQTKSSLSNKRTVLWDKKNPHLLQPPQVWRHNPHQGGSTNPTGSFLLPDRVDLITRQGNSYNPT